MAALRNLAITILPTATALGTLGPVGPVSHNVIAQLLTAARIAAAPRAEATS